MFTILISAATESGQKCRAVRSLAGEQIYPATSELRPSGFAASREPRSFFTFLVFLSALTAINLQPSAPDSAHQSHESLEKIEP
jgi:hypothetical protein